MATEPFKEWISVRDKTPPEYEYVLVFAKKIGTDEPCPISLARCCDGEWEMLNNSPESNAVCGDLAWYMDEDEITHWMHLPNPPKEG